MSTFRPHRPQTITPAEPVHRWTSTGVACDDFDPLPLLTRDEAAVSCTACIDAAPRGERALLDAVLSGAANDPHLTDEAAAAIDAASPINVPPGLIDTMDSLVDEVATGQRDVVDVTDVLTPGARARAVQRTATMLLSAGLLDITPEPVTPDQHYQAGAHIAELVHPRAAERHALRHARQALAVHGPRAAAFVLAGFTGTPAEAVR